MRPITRRLALGTAACLPFAARARAADSSWDAIAGSATLRVGVIAARPPYFWKENGQWTGFSAQMGRDVAEALGKEMGIEEATMTEADFHRLWEAFFGREIDRILNRP